MNDQELKKYLQAKGNLQTELFTKANKLREEYIGNDVHFRGIIEFSNHCEKNCDYCGIRSGNKKIERYCMSKEEIKECLDFIDQVKYGSVVLQSGELTSPAAKKFLLEVVQLINQEYPEMGITLSCGELDSRFLKELKEAGAHRYLLRIETSNPKLYEKIHPASHSLKNRIKTLENLKKLDYQVGCGNMVGIPGQTLDDLITDLHFFQDLDFDMFGLGPYVIHEDTPLGNSKNKKWWVANKEEIFNTTLNFIALLRILIPTANIATATALDVFKPQGRVWALKAGANIIMPSVTPQKYRDKYLLYQDKPCVDEDPTDCIDCTIEKVKMARLNPVLGKQGNSLHYKNRHG
ncbi:[FeFe] hydrogenase H-cluster radical SAM maturase HydE [Candidatus Gracilibacteria bacterium]|nr:[FeFe] hydrogenase H-cluster radical SAM maturase HydE [Candidatus Gracilibacteria bacterium]